MLDWLNTPQPHVELANRRESGWLAENLPEVDVLYGVPQPEAHHPEICTGKHMELCLAIASELSNSFDVRFAVLTHDLGKGLTPKDEWPQHFGHERGGLEPLEGVVARLAVPESAAKLARLVCEHHLQAHRAFELKPTSVVKFLDDNGMLEDGELLKNFMYACESDARGRLGLHDKPYPQTAYMLAAREAVVRHPYPEGVTMLDPAGNRIHAERVYEVKQLRKVMTPPKEEPAC